MAEDERRVTRDDVLDILIKYAPTPNDPDDAETIRLFQEQEAKKVDVPVATQKGKP